MKPKVAFFDFACCEGCQLQIANLEEDIIGLVNLVDVVEFREVLTGKRRGMTSPSSKGQSPGPKMSSDKGHPGPLHPFGGLRRLRRDRSVNNSKTSAAAWIR